MRRRRGSRSDYLMVSDRSGFTFPASEMVKEMTLEGKGLMVHRSEVDNENMQLFVKSLNDPQALREVRPREPSAPYCPLRYVHRGYGLVDEGRDFPAAFPTIATASGDPGMEIECSFQVAPDSLSNDITRFYAIGASAADPYGYQIVTAGTAISTAARPNFFVVS